ncbi:MAG: nuclear transport factor 2 family protein [Sphingomicrobium sp.]
MPDLPTIFARAAMVAKLAAGASPILAHGPVVKATVATSAVAPAARGAAAAVDAFHAALGRGDTRTAAALLADNVLIFESGEVERSKAEFAAHHLGADAIFAQAVRSTVARRSGNADGKTAWIVSEGRTVGRYAGQAIDLVTTETMLLRRVGQTWRIAHVHWSSAKRK